jgi:23S rRNA (uracil1939-C5)-methyltransferase
MDASGHRPVLACPVAHACGGCPLIGYTEAAQSESKLTRIRLALQAAYGKDAAASLNPAWVASPDAFGYRNRIRVRIDEGGELTFFNAAKSFGCAVLEVSVRHALERLRRELRTSRGAFSAFAHAEVRAPGFDGRPSVVLVGRETPAPLPATAREAVATLHTRGWWVQIAGDDAGVVQRYPLRDAWWDVPLGSFMQVNSAVNQLLVEHAVVGAARRGLASFADLFSGAGNFALPLAASGLQGTAVELDVRAAHAASCSATEQGLTDLTMLAGDAQVWAEAAVRRMLGFDLVVLDPPRAGLKGGAVAYAALARSHILLCSCNPAVLSVDLGALAEQGFAPESVTAFDMFPQTEHVEVAVWLRRKPRQ